MGTDLLILCATLPEIEGFISLFPPDSKHLFPTGPIVFSGKKGNQRYDLLISGPGVFNTAHALTAYLEHSSCPMILQTGIAGVFKESGLSIGDLAIASTEEYIHTGVTRDSLVNEALPFDLIDSMPLTRKGRYDFDPDLVNKYYENLSRSVTDKPIQVAKGPFITVSAITASHTLANRLYSAFSPLMEAMEGAAAAHIAALYKIPMIEIRTASNFVGERDKGKWNINKAVQHIAEFMIRAWVI
jgi:futalosine hydrolase